MASEELATDSLSLFRRPNPLSIIAVIANICSIIGAYGTVRSWLTLIGGREITAIWLVLGIVFTVVAVAVALALLTFRFGPFPDRQFWQGLALGGTSVALVSLGIFMAVYFAEGGTSVNISQPEDADEVEVEVLVKGSFSSLPDDQSIWVAVVPLGLDERLFHPQNGPAEKFFDGTWQAQVFVGLDDPADFGRRFEIHAIVAKGDADQWFRDYLARGRATGDFSGQPSLPAGSAIMDTVTVKRLGEPRTRVLEPPGTVSIEEPVDGAQVDVQTAVHGHYSGLAPEATIYVFVRPLPDQPGSWFVQNPVTFSSDGTWFNTSFIGGPDDPPGTRFGICAAISEQAYQPNQSFADDELARIQGGRSACVSVTRRGTVPTPPDGNDTTNGTTTRATTAPVMLTIDQPANGAQVNLETAVRGRYSGLGPQDTIYVFVRPLPDLPGSWFVQNPVTTSPDGTWSNTSFVGVATDPAGTPFTICAVVSDQSYQPNQSFSDDDFEPMRGDPSPCISVARASSGPVVTDSVTVTQPPPPTSTPPPTLTPPPTRTQTTPPKTLMIIQPQNGDLVNVAVLVEGSFSGLSDDQSIWVAVVPLGLDEELFHPQDGPAEKFYDGSWQAQIFVGLDDPADYGRSFEIHAIVAEGDAEQRFRDYLVEGRKTGDFPGLPALPAGSAIVDTVTVTRRTP